MPQEFYVLKCFSCETFQVHIVKKSNKWECKMCRAKQSLKRNYGKGSSKDCRNKVMKLNELRVTTCYSSNQMKGEIFDKSWTADFISTSVKKETKELKLSNSKWAEYVEDVPDTESDIDDNGGNSLIAVVDKKRMKKKAGSYFSKNKRICRRSSESELFSVEYEEGMTLSTAPNFGFVGNIENIDSKDFIQLKNKSNSGKFAKYSQCVDDNNDLIQKTNKIPNLFESSLTDLDEILNF